MLTYGERLTGLMRRAGLTYEHMARLLNVSVQRAENLITGYCEPDIDTLLRTAQIFDVAPSFIAGLSDEERCSEPDVAKEIFVINPYEKAEEMLTNRNLMGVVYMNREQMHGKDYFAIAAKDDSMKGSRIFKDDLLIVRRQCDANNGDVVVAADGSGELVIRRYNRVGNIVTLTADGDLMKYKTIKIDTMESKLSIFGKVCEIRVQKI